MHDLLEMDAWAKDYNPRKKVQMVSDPDKSFVKKLGVPDSVQNFALVVKDGIVDYVTMNKEDCRAENVLNKVA
ncbi:hypothetical protein HK103_000830 [Boothiomyces macroporosus]|uniref:Redoxin domain-containing protein n=1 Tax=Boothiomyces macroporosus TaxID=261099 RepID=A0AAD5Y3F7_9FUNG|nr:hypothetical protein HK103_000830 [Boothiomyces macroporosus]